MLIESVLALTEFLVRLVPQADLLRFVIDRLVMRFLWKQPVFLTHDNLPDLIVIDGDLQVVVLHFSLHQVVLLFFVFFIVFVLFFDGATAKPSRERS